MDTPIADGCSGWDNARCQGTPLCPPRCPRFVDKRGTPLLVRPLDNASVDEAALSALYDCESAARSTSYPPYATPWAIEDWLDGLRARGWNVVALDGDRVVGHAVFTPADAAVPEFGVFVDPAYRSRGIAGELLRHAIAHAAVAGRDAITMAVQRENRAMRSIAVDHGFEAVRRSGHDEWIEFVTYRLPLTPTTARERFGLVSTPE